MKIKLVMTDRRFMGNQIEVPQDATLLTADIPEGLTLEDVRMALKFGDAELQECDPKEKVELFLVPADRLPAKTGEKPSDADGKKRSQQGAAKSA